MNFRPIYRITTFVPPDHLERLLNGITTAYPLQHGNYDKVFWWSGPGTEQFRPLSGANPSYGELDSTSRSASIQVVFSIPRDAQILEHVLQNGLIPNHPWEVPAIYIDESLAIDVE
jgi:hypothetical protein